MSSPIKLINSDARWLPLAAQSVHCVITSPPYWGLRDYGTAQWVGGDSACDHKPGNVSRIGKTGLQGGTATSGHLQEDYRHVCSKCGAARIDSQIGLERTPHCGRTGLLKLRSDLTAAQLEYVVRRLLGGESRNVPSDDNEHRK